MRTISIILLAFIIHFTQAQINPINQPSTNYMSETDTIAPPDFEPIQLKSAIAALETFHLFSPDESVELIVGLSSNNITYQVLKDEENISSSSIINLQIGSGYLTDGVTCLEAIRNSKNQTINLPYGERNEVTDNHNELILKCQNNRNEKFEYIFRSYNEGIAFRINFTNESPSSINISKEDTQLNLSHTYTAYAESRNEQGYIATSTTQSFSSLIPLTFTNSEHSLCFNEAGNDNYVRVRLNCLGNNKFKTSFLSTNSSVSTPYALPWRYLVIGDNPTDLIYKKEMMYALNSQEYDEAKWSWVKPGKVFRSLVLTTEGGKKAIDFCSEMNIDYMMFDAGWYGLGYGMGNESSSASNPLDVIDGLNMEEVTEYGKSKNVGVVLYINKVAWYNYNNTSMFDLYESWGIKGVKLGFMDGYSAYGNKYIYNLIKKAGEKEMLVNVHDNPRPTGLTQKYPNLMTTEGVRGNEYVYNNGNHTTLLPFTRFLTGAADYTICYFGNDPDYTKPKALGTTRAHQLALSILFYSPFQHVFWYGAPHIYTVPVETELFKYIPTIWDDFQVPAAQMGHYISMARKSGNRWFLSCITNNLSREIDIPLSFLEEGINYKATIYKDKDPKTIEKISTDLESLKTSGSITDGKLHVSLKANGGQVIVFNSNNTGLFDKEKHIKKIAISPNPSKGMFRIGLPDNNNPFGDMDIYSTDGQCIVTKKNTYLNDYREINLSNVSSGVYIITIKCKTGIYSGKITIIK